MRQVPPGHLQESADEQAAADGQDEPGHDHDGEDDDPLRHGFNVGIGSDRFVLKHTLSSP
jgi:hypothetical protein